MRRSLFLKSTGVTVIALLLFAASVKSREARESELNELGISVTSTTPQPRQPITPNAEIPVTLPEQSELEVDARVVLLTLRPTGFEPKEINLPAGKYLVIVRNRSGLEEFALRLERETGEVVHQARAQRLKRDVKHFVDFIPGVYFLKETNHPDWTCRITITNR